MHVDIILTCIPPTHPGNCTQALLMWCVIVNFNALAGVVSVTVV